MNNLPSNQKTPPRHDLIIITQSGGYKHDDDDDTDVGITNEALDIAATQVGKNCTKFTFTILIQHCSFEYYFASLSKKISLERQMIRFFYCGIVDLFQCGAS